MKYRDVLDGHLHVEQGKTGTRVRIPTALRLTAIGMSIQDCIDRSRTPRVLSQYLLHHCRPVGRVEAGDPIRSGKLSREVASLIKQVGYQPRSGRLPPSLHEIRSLAARLWAEQHGPEFSQALLGHKSSDMTALYRDVRGAEWITVRVG